MLTQQLLYVVVKGAILHNGNMLVDLHTHQEDFLVGVCSETLDMTGVSAITSTPSNIRQ